MEKIKLFLNIVDKSRWGLIVFKSLIDRNEILSFFLRERLFYFLLENGYVCAAIKTWRENDSTI